MGDDITFPTDLNNLYYSTALLSKDRKYETVGRLNSKM